MKATNQTYALFFKEETIAGAMEHRGYRSHDELKYELGSIFDNAHKIYAIYDTDRIGDTNNADSKPPRKEIRIIADMGDGYAMVFLCSATNGKKKLHCFRIIEQQLAHVKNIKYAKEVEHKFIVYFDGDSEISTDDARIFREELKEAYLQRDRLAREEEQKLLEEQTRIQKENAQWYSEITHRNIELLRSMEIERLFAHIFSCAKTHIYIACPWIRDVYMEYKNNIESALKRGVKIHIKSGMERDGDKASIYDEAKKHLEDLASKYPNLKLYLEAKNDHSKMLLWDDDSNKQWLLCGSYNLLSFCAKFDESRGEHASLTCDKHVFNKAKQELDKYFT